MGGKTGLKGAANSEMPSSGVITTKDCDPVKRLTEHCGKIAWRIALVAGVHNKCCFKVSTVINGKEFIGTGTTSRIAKNMCALTALKEISGEEKSCNQKQITDGEEEIRQNYTSKRGDKKLQLLQNITNLQLYSNRSTGKSNVELNEKLISKNLKQQLYGKASACTNRASVLGDSVNNQDKEIVTSASPFSTEKTGDVNLDSNLITRCSELNSPKFLNPNAKMSADSFLKNSLPEETEEIDDVCVASEQNNIGNLPSSSKSCMNSSSNLNSLLRNELTTLKSTHESCSNLDITSVHTMEMNVSIKRFATNTCINPSVMCSQVRAARKGSKRRREESPDIIEIPAAKICATDKNNVLLNQQNDASECLQRLQSKLKFILEAEIGNSNEPYFMVSTEVDNRKFYGHGKTKNLAKKDAAMQVLNFRSKKSVLPVKKRRQSKLRPNKQECQQIILHYDSSHEICSSFLFPSKYVDVIESKIMQAYDKLTHGLAEFSGYKVIAGIVMTAHMNFYKSMVVSVATGTKCVNGGNICCNGSVLNDCHAEVLAKRGLMKFLFTQLRNHCSFETMNSSVFEKTSNGYRLKPFVHFHLYINTAPCGDGRVFNFDHISRFNNMLESSFNSLQFGRLRTKVEGELGTTPIGSRFFSQTWDGVVLGEPLHTMSCSDKIALWNVVGIQGALLSQFIEPIYLHSITLGSLFNASHMHRAVCGRIQDTLGNLPQSYHLNMPMLGQTSKTLRRCTFKVPKTGISWTFGDNNIEIISMPTGRTICNETSFLSKQAFFFKYFYLRQNLPNLYCGSLSNIYAEAKENSHAYQYAKREVYSAFHRANLGDWVKKPKEQNEFAMNIN